MVMTFWLILSFFVCGFLFTGNQEDYEYMRKFSSTEDSINQSSPTSSYHYPVYSQLDKSGKNFNYFGIEVRISRKYFEILPFFAYYNIKKKK